MQPCPGLSQREGSEPAAAPVLRIGLWRVLLFLAREVRSAVGYLVRRLVGVNESFFKAHGELLFLAHMVDLQEARWRFVLKRMTPPNLCLVSWTGITGGASNGVDTAASARIILGHARGYVRGVAGLASHFKKVHHCFGLRQCHGASKAELVKLQPDWLE